MSLVDQCSGVLLPCHFVQGDSHGVQGDSRCEFQVDSSYRVLVRQMDSPGSGMVDQRLYGLHQM